MYGINSFALFMLKVLSSWPLPVRILEDLRNLQPVLTPLAKEITKQEIQGSRD